MTKAEFWIQIYLREHAAFLEKPRTMGPLAVARLSAQAADAALEEYKERFGDDEPGMVRL